MTATPQDINDVAKEILRQNYEFESEPPIGNALRITDLRSQVQQQLIQLGKTTSNDNNCVGFSLGQILLRYREDGQRSIRELGKSLRFWKKRGNELDVPFSEIESCPEAAASPQAAPEAVALRRGGIALAAGGRVRGGNTAEALGSATKRKVPKKATPKKATPKKATPKKATPKKAVTKKKTAKKAIPKKATTKSVTKKKASKKPFRRNRHQRNEL